MPKGYKLYPSVCKKSGYLTSLSVRRTEESVSNVAEIMEIKAWINRLFHLRSRGRSHSSDASQRKKEDPGTTYLQVPHRGRHLCTRGECNEWQKDYTRVPSSGRMDTYRVILPYRWRADVPMSFRANPLVFVLY
ncbi:hypothetical protein TNCV_4129471 [Trichonephila clavipes]|nr:hypothetical protein TNCV_4129471 [Trichonephila clavipes]